MPKERKARRGGKRREDDTRKIPKKQAKTRCGVDQPEGPYIGRAKMEKRRTYAGHSGGRMGLWEK